MKAMKYVLIGIILMFPFATIVASHSQGQSPFTQPATYAQYEFHTTSALTGSGSSLPNAALSGVVMSGNAPGESSPANAPSGPRRIGGSGSGTGGNGAEESSDPQETPIGDGMWVLMALAMMYGAYMVYRRRKEETV